MVLFVLAGCDGFAFQNSPPDVYFLSPESGAVVSWSQSVTLVAAVADDNDAIDKLDYYLLLADGSALTAEPDVDREAGTVSLTVEHGLPRGTPTLTLRVVDSHGESASASRMVTVFDNLPPTLTWVSPVDGGRYAGGTDLSVEVEVTDPDPLADTSMTLSWSGSAVQGQTGLPTMLDASGTVRFELAGLAITHWELGLTVVDTLDGEGSSTVGFDVVSGDHDMDGYFDVALGGDDCDDTSGAVHPGATESCNGRDDDCDGVVDEAGADAPLRYRDADGDGYGWAGDSLRSCDPVAGRVDNDGDCDDSRSDVNPDAVEVCNTLDDDCDGDVDGDAVDKVTVWLDFDEDGYGAGEPWEVCEPAADEVFNAVDCDDGDDTVYPGAPELCDVGNDDEDCDGLAGNDDPDSTGTRTAWADADGDGYGDPASTRELCTLTAGWVDNADDCDDTDATAWSGGAEVCEDGLDFDCDGFDGECTLVGTVQSADADVTLSGSAYAAAGTLVRALDDLDGDGLGDFAVTGNYNEVYLVRAAGLTTAPLGVWPTVAGSGSDLFGYALVSTDDLDGDGAPELYVGAPLAGATYGGAVYRFDPTGTADLLLGDAVAAISGADDEQLGLDVAGPIDLDGDGTAAELLVAGDGGLRVYGPDLVEAATWTTPAGSGGAPLARVPDCDGDGLDDILVGDGADDTAWLVFGGLSGDFDLASADLTFTAAAFGDSTGDALAGLGDVDGDGLGDLAIGAPGSPSDTSTNAGRVTFWSGLGGTPASTTIRGVDSGDRAGIALGAGGDLDGDGLADLLVGATGDDCGGSDSGSTSLLYGTATPSSWDLSAPDAWICGAAGDQLGGAGTGVVDLNGDGVDDLVVGAVSAGSLSAGAAFVFYGGSL